MLFKTLTYGWLSRPCVSKKVQAHLDELLSNGLITTPQVSARFVRAFTVKSKHIRQVELFLKRKDIPYKKEPGA